MVDLAGNQPLAGGATLLASYDTTGPIVSGVQATPALAGQPANTIVVNFAAKEIDPSTASNPANYQLNLITASGTTPVALAAPDSAPMGTTRCLPGRQYRGQLLAAAGRPIRADGSEPDQRRRHAHGRRQHDDRVHGQWRCFRQPVKLRFAERYADAINNASAQMLWEDRPRIRSR